MFDYFAAEPFIEKAKLLHEQSVPLWGKMSAQHMVEHLYLVLKISYGAIRVNVFTQSDKIEQLKKIFLQSDKPFQKNFINPVTGEHLLPLQNKTLFDAVDELNNSITMFNDYYRMNPQALNKHPVFGALNKNEWIIFHNKHFTHHYQQFGLI